MSIHGVSPIQGDVSVLFPNLDSFLSFNVRVSAADSPMIHDLSDQRRLDARWKSLTNMLDFANGTRVPLLARRSRLFMHWSLSSDETLYFEAELEMVHSRFDHTSSEKLYELLQRAKSDEVDADTRKQLHDLTSCCTRVSCANGKRFCAV